MKTAQNADDYASPTPYLVHSLSYGWTVAIGARSSHITWQYGGWQTYPGMDWHATQAEAEAQFNSIKNSEKS